jgi:hypothetical protein
VTDGTSPSVVAIEGEGVVPAPITGLGTAVTEPLLGIPPPVGGDVVNGAEAAGAALARTGVF